MKQKNYSLLFAVLLILVSTRIYSSASLAGPVINVDSLKNVLCNGGNNGAIFVSASGGTAPYNYIWSSGTTIGNLTGLPAGTYSVFVQDAVGDTATKAFVVTQPPALLINPSTNHVSCNGGSNGSAVVTTTGGTGPYTYLWSNGATNQTVTGLVAGTYFCTVTDSKNCVSQINILILQSTQVTVSLINKTDATCGLSNGIANLMANGGSAPYSYLWSNGNTTWNATGLVPGSYSFFVSDAGGCTASLSFVINEINCDSIVVTPAPCGGGNGSATAYPYFGTAPYTYSWSTGETTQTINAPYGFYSVSMTDSLGLIQIDNCKIITNSAPSIFISSNRTFCLGKSDTISITAWGGALPYTYLWSPSTGINNPNISNPSVSPSVTTTYTAIVTDANGCANFGKIDITVNPLPVASASPDKSICIGMSAQLSASGGTSYLWSPSANISCAYCMNPICTPSSTTTYSVVVTNANGCTSTSTTKIIVNSGPQDSLVISPASCGGGNGTVTAYAYGGTPPYSYSWMSGSTASATSGPIGQYFVTITDSNQCMTGDTATLITVNAPALVMGPDKSICNGTSDTIKVTASGGALPYSYTWSPTNGLNNATIFNPLVSPTTTTDYSVWVSDNVGCANFGKVKVTVSSVNMSVTASSTICQGNTRQLYASGASSYSWSTGSTTYFITVSPSVTTTYTVTGTFVGCSVSKTTTVTVNPSPVINLSHDTTICLGKSLTLSASGGTSYSWTPFQNLTCQSCSSTVATPTATTTYKVYVTNSNGCVSNATVIVTVTTSNCNYNFIKGSCFVDYNGNGMKDAGEPPFRNTLVFSAGTTTMSSTPDSQGKFLNYLTDTGSFITTLQNVAGYYTVTPLQYNSHFSTYNNYDSTDFALAPMPGIQDLRITMIPLGPLRLGSDVGYRLQYSNVGTDTMSGTINMKKDSRTTYKTSVPFFASTNGDSASWNYSNLLPNATRTIDVTLTVLIPPAANLGDLLSFSSVIEPVATDSMPNDNYSGLGEQRIIGAYDPNDKTMLGGDFFTVDQLAKGDYLTYLIRFQNTGNDTAFKIVVRDTLDSKLDGSTFEMISASNEYSLSIENQKNVAWTFDNVLLPDSNVNEPASHGYVCFRIKTKNGLSAGDVIQNTGHIFFDYNADVITNTTQTTIVTGIENISSKATGLQLHPNPAKNEFTVFSLQYMTDADLEVYNLIGAIVHSEKFTGNQITINCKQLPNGIYFVKVNDNAGVLRLMKVD